MDYYFLLLLVLVIVLIPALYIKGPGNLFSSKKLEPPEGYIFVCAVCRQKAAQILKPALVEFEHLPYPSLEPFNIQKGKKRVCEKCFKKMMTGALQ